MKIVPPSPLMKATIHRLDSAQLQLTLRARRCDSRAVAPPDVFEPVHDQSKHLWVVCPPLDVAFGVGQTVCIAACKVQRGVGSAANLAICRKRQKKHVLLRRKKRIHVPVKRRDIRAAIK